MNDEQMRENIKITAEEARWMLADGITVTQHAQEVLWAEERIDDLEDELAALREAAQEAYNIWCPEPRGSYHYTSLDREAWEALGAALQERGE